MSDFGIELEGYRSPSRGRPSYAEGSNPPIAVAQVIRCSDGSSSVTGALMLHPNAARALLIKRDGAMTR
jgi:hypothetical protein